MDAAQLVEQRKTGAITQDQFFIALNLLRRANSGLGNGSNSSSSSAAAPIAQLSEGKAVGAVTPDERRQAWGRCDTEKTIEVAGSSGEITAQDRTAARSWMKEAAGSSAERPECAICAKLPGEDPHALSFQRQLPSPPVPRGSRVGGSFHTGDTLVRSEELGHINQAMASERCDPLRLDGENLCPSVCPTSNRSDCSDVTESTREGSSQRHRPQQYEQRQRQHDGTTVAVEDLLSGEVDQQPRDVSIPHNGGDSEWLCPRGEQSPAHRSHRSRKDAKRDPLSHTLLGERRRHLTRRRRDPGPTPTAQHEHRSPALQRLEEARGRVLKPPPPSSSPKCFRATQHERNSREGPLQASTVLKQQRAWHGGTSSSGSLTFDECQSFQRVRGVGTELRDGEDDHISTRSLPSPSNHVQRRNPAKQDEHCWWEADAAQASAPTRARSLTQKQSGRESSQKRSSRCSRNRTLDASGAPNSYAVARRDRYGYPLPERECLGSYGAPGRSKPKFAPMIKGLPSFYLSRSRSKLEETPERSVIGSAGEHAAGLGQYPSVYKRTTGWLAKADALRAHKLAQREEREMDACTFQPNAKPQRGTPSSDIAACRADIARGFPRSSAKTRGSSDCEADSVAGGSSAVASKCKTDSETRKSRSNVCGSGSGGGDIVGGDVGKRLFEEHKRLKERRFEREERKRMQEEEAYARTCTFKPSLAHGLGATASSARSRYRDAPRAAEVPPDVHSANQQTPTFQPKIVGVHPGMARATEYVSVDVSERLYRAARFGRRQRLINARDEQANHQEGYNNRDLACSPEDLETRYRGRPCEGRAHWERSRGDPLYSPQPRLVRCSDRPDNQHHQHEHRDRRNPKCVNSAGAEPEGRVECDDSDCESCDVHRRRRSEECRGLEHLQWDHVDGRPHEPASSRATYTVTRPRLRPRSAPPATGEREGNWGTQEHQQRHDQHERQHQDQRSAFNVRSEAGRREGRGQKWVERGPKGGGQPQRQGAISFQEFLVRQAHSQANASQRLSRLKRMHSPSFTPRLSRGSRNIVARNGASAGGGCFEDRLEMTARRRQRDRKAALSAARASEDKACSFSPQLTPRSGAARSRSARELSLGDSVLRAAKQRMARAREDIRLLEDPDGNRGSFQPTLETAGDELAPPATSRLRLADGLDTYLERVQETAMVREEERLQERRRHLAKEARVCTFKPQTKDCPELVRRTAAGMRCIREFRRTEALASGSRTPAPQSGWR